MTLEIVPGISIEDFEAVLEPLPDPATYASFFLNGYFDISNINRQAGDLVQGIKLYAQEGLKLAMHKPSKDVLKRVYRHEIGRAIIGRPRTDETEPSALIQLGEAKWHLYSLKGERMIGEICVSSTTVKAYYSSAQEPPQITDLRKVIESRKDIPFNLEIGRSRRE